MGRGFIIGRGPVNGKYLPTSGDVPEQSEQDENIKYLVQPPYWFDWNASWPDDSSYFSPSEEYRYSLGFSMNFFTIPVKSIEKGKYQLPPFDLFVGSRRSSGIQDTDDFGLYIGVVGETYYDFVADIRGTWKDSDLNKRYPSLNSNVRQCACTLYYDNSYRDSFFHIIYGSESYKTKSSYAYKEVKEDLLTVSNIDEYVKNNSITIAVVVCFDVSNFASMTYDELIVPMGLNLFGDYYSYGNNTLDFVKATNIDVNNFWIGKDYGIGTWNPTKFYPTLSSGGWYTCPAEASSKGTIKSKVSIPLVRTYDTVKDTYVTSGLVYDDITFTFYAAPYYYTNIGLPVKIKFSGVRYNSSSFKYETINSAYETSNTIWLSDFDGNDIQWTVQGLTKLIPNLSSFISLNMIVEIGGSKYPITFGGSVSDISYEVSFSNYKAYVNTSGGGGEQPSTSFEKKTAKNGNTLGTVGHKIIKNWNEKREYIPINENGSSFRNPVFTCTQITNINHWDEPWAFAGYIYIQGIRKDSSSSWFIVPLQQYVGNKKNWEFKIRDNIEYTGFRFQCNCADWYKPGANITTKVSDIRMVSCEVPSGTTVIESSISKEVE